MDYNQMLKQEKMIGLKRKKSFSLFIIYNGYCFKNTNYRLYVIVFTKRNYCLNMLSEIMISLLSQSY